MAAGLSVHINPNVGQYRCPWPRGSSISGVGFNLAYYNPGCGFSDRFVLSRQAKDDSKSQMLTLSAETGQLLADQVVPGQFSSPVPARDGIVAAASGSPAHWGGFCRKPPGKN